jgi:Ca-activated chloride channel family protein
MKKRLSHAIAIASDSYRTQRALPWLLSLLTMLFLLSPLNSMASRGTIAGQVTNANDAKTPQAGAQVQLLLSGQVRAQKSTDAQGRFSFDNVWPGVYEVKASFEGRTANQSGISMSMGQTVNIQISLPEVVLKEVQEIVDASKTPTDVTVEDISGAADISYDFGEIDGAENVNDVMAQSPRMVPPSASYSVQTTSGKAMAKMPSPARMSYKVPAPDPISHSEGYASVNENDFIETQKEATSTFSIDVDAASYTNTRRFLMQENRMPPPDAVRLEEYINYFEYDYPQPTDGRPFSITTEISECPWNTQHKLVHVGLQGKNVENHNLPPSNIVFLLDVSGSMSSSNKLPLVKKGLKMLVQQLRPEDKVAIVVYAGAAGEVLPSTSGSNKQAIVEAMDKLQAGGSTAGGQGIELAYKIAQKNMSRQGNNRVILCTDGDFNVGVSGDEALVKLIEEKRKTGIFLTVLGFGTGNLQDSKMEKLADNGNGNYGYIDTEKEAQKVFINETGGTLLTIAKDVKLQLSFHPEKVKAYRLIGYANRVLENKDFDDDKKDAGELGAGHTVTALYEVIPMDKQAETRSSASNGQSDSYRIQPRPAKKGLADNELLTVRLRYKPPHADVSKLIEVSLIDKQIALAASSENYRWSAAVAGFGMLMRKSKHCGTLRYDEVLALAKGALGKDAHGYRAEFLTMVEMAKKLDGNVAAGK